MHNAKGRRVILCRTRIGLYAVSDTHGVFTWMDNGCLDKYIPEETAIIILGDASFNFWLNKKDERLKREVSAKGFTFYCVRGNHEARPQDVEGMDNIYDENVQGVVYLEEEFPLIRYFFDYGEYTINGFKCAVLGGAYSIDKCYRLARAGITDKTDPRYYNPKVTHWFHNEQLSEKEMNDAMEILGNKHYDFIFTHTCPVSWEPTDLFLSMVDQSSVDKSMELWLEEFKESITFNVWCFGHFHADRLERPYVEQYYNNIEGLETIWHRWGRYSRTGELDWWLVKSPSFYTP